MIQISRKPCMAPDVFIGNYLQKNEPVIVTNAMTGWSALRDWGPDYLKQKCGDFEVQVYDELFTLVDLEKLSTYLDKNFGQSAGAESTDYVRAYVRFKDIDFPWADKLFQVLENDWGHPAFFPRDSFTLPSSSQGDSISPVTDVFPYKGLFVSGRGVRTRLHRDPFGTDAILCQFYGEKKVVFYEPHHVDKVMSGSEFVDSMAVDHRKFPKFSSIEPSYEDVLKPGEILFIPNGWFHEVTTLSDSISITWNFVHNAQSDAYWREVADPRNDFDRDMLVYLGSVS